VNADTTTTATNPVGSRAAWFDSIARGGEQLRAGRVSRRADQGHAFLAGPHRPRETSSSPLSIFPSRGDAPASLTVAA
jgi:hypothetical protein